MSDIRPRTLCLIPARSGSKRVPNKNILDVNGHPLLAYTIAAAVESGIFDAVVVSTDSEKYANIARHYGAEVPFLRPAEFAEDTSPDIEWVALTLEWLRSQERQFDLFSILRPTSPFRTASTIQRAMRQFRSADYADSIRAVELCTQHPGKMWRFLDDLLVPVLAVQPEGTQWFSSPTQSLPEVWVQNASLEIARVRCVTDQNSISGSKIIGFKTQFPEGIDINFPEDVLLMKNVIEKFPHSIPEILVDPIN